MMKSGVLLSDDVVEELDCDPAVDCGRIAVGVRDGVVTLLGSVPGFWQKDRAEDAVRQVMGVRALANDLKVLLRGTHVGTDTDIAAAAATALSWHTDLPQTITVTVCEGWVTLTGTVDGQSQRAAAANAIVSLRGVDGVVNRITVKPKPSAAE